MPDFQNQDELVAWSGSPEGVAYFARLNEALMAGRTPGQPPAGVVSIQSEAPPEPSSPETIASAPLPA